MAIYPYTKPYIPVTEQRATKASRTDRPLPDYIKPPREIHIVWTTDNDVADDEVARLYDQFKDKRLKGVRTLEEAHAVLTALLAYRNIPIHVLLKNVPKPLHWTVKNSIHNLLGVVYWKLPNNVYQMKTQYLQTISSSISITTQSKVY